MKKILYIFLLVGTFHTPVHAASITTELTSCSHLDALKAFMGAAFFGTLPYQDVLKTLNEAGEDCTLDVRTFELVKAIESFDHKGFTYDLVEIKMDDGTTRYAFHYYPTVKGDKT